MSTNKFETLSDLNEYYVNVRLAISNNKNLESHLREIDDAIAELNKLIDHAKANHKPTTGFENLKNELFFLVFEIKEKL